ncbi:hypothetical protein OHA18_38435 [Kribbella sp. NBC_00709]|uniref:hypothetical protein n=1 Tax=Kribbella sp. NBC_00709 TaxID=2975972 RepID=UPI002E2A7EDA|nr:hypothetical protein [Kribbella sp. NBC_00709]
METTTERSPALQGVAFGVSIVSFFALGWLGWGTGGHLPTAAQICLVVAAALLSVALAAVAWRRWFTTRTPPPVADTSRRMSGRTFGLIIGVEWIGLGVVSGVLGGTGHTDQIAAVICAGVGLHFIPLAKLFGVRAYYVTAAVMCLLAVLTFILAPSTPALWTMLPGIGSAVTLYATCVALLRWRPDQSRS